MSVQLCIPIQPIRKRDRSVGACARPCSCSLANAVLAPKGCGVEACPQVMGIMSAFRRSFALPGWVVSGARAHSIAYPNAESGYRAEAPDIGHCESRCSRSARDNRAPRLAERLDMRIAYYAGGSGPTPAVELLVEQGALQSAARSASPAAAARVTAETSRARLSCPQSLMKRSSGSRECPMAVSEYSTLGGTSR